MDAILPYVDIGPGLKKTIKKSGPIKEGIFQQHSKCGANEVKLEQISQLPVGVKFPGTISKLYPYLNCIRSPECRMYVTLVDLNTLNIFFQKGTKKQLAMFGLIRSTKN